MKESITKFDLEAAFKALDDLETPVAERGIRANKPALNEIFSRKSKFDALFEEYYDISSTEELSEAQDSREAEIAKAKLARIEKIVDLDADSPDDLLASYVGKYIIQCPQCMTLFYKNPEDVETSEEDETIVNVTEVCQHCGNDSGYTLIGKVGAADEAPAGEEETASEEGDLDLSVEDTDAETEDAATDEGGTSDEEDFDLDAELSDLDLSVEEGETAEEEEDDSKEEAFNTKNDGNYLLEQLTEDADVDETSEADMDISDAEFAELLSSPEFTKPVSDKAAKAMLDNMEEALVPSEELEEAVEAEDDEEALNEAGFMQTLGKLGKTLVKKGKQTAGKVGDAVSKSVDKFADNTMTREEKADWVMHNTLKPEVKRVEVDNDGNVIPNEKDQKFDTYVVIGYKGYYSDGDPINMSPTRSNEDLVIGMPEPQFRKTYTEAEELAKGWSMDQKGGPAFILLTKGQDIGAAAYLCQFFKGELDAKQDQLENYFKAAKQDLEGKAHITKGGGIKGGQDGPKTEARQASAIKVGDIIVLGKTAAKVTKVSESKFQAGSWTIEVQDGDGDTDTVTFKGTQKVTVVISSGEANESYTARAASLSSIMENLEELNEDALEALVSQSLIEAYKNVAGFRLTGCNYLNDTLTVTGTVFFESGCSRELSYKFTSAAVKNDQIAFKGLNEKLGQQKNFFLVGKADNKVFIAESFRQR